jgi:hypothetical protein
MAPLVLPCLRLTTASLSPTSVTSSCTHHTISRGYSDACLSWFLFTSYHMGVTVVEEFFCTKYYLTRCNKPNVLLVLTHYYYSKIFLLLLPLNNISHFRYL